MFVIDCSLHTTKHIACLKEAGVDVVFRYYARRKQPDYEEKILRSDEAIALSEAGISIAVVYQYNARSPGKCNYDQGLSDGRVARKYAHKTIKQPAGTAIYFGVDYDPLHEHKHAHPAAFQGAGRGYARRCALCALSHWCLWWLERLRPVRHGEARQV